MDENTRQLFEERLRFEQLLSDLSAKFVNIPTDRVDAEISSGLEEIARFLDVDRAILWERSPDDGRFYANHSWSMAEVEGLPARMGDADFPWVIERTRRGEVTIIPRLEDLPEEAVKEKRWGQEDRCEIGCRRSADGGRIPGFYPGAERSPG